MSVVEFASVPSNSAFPRFDSGGGLTSDLRPVVGSGRYPSKIEPSGEDESSKKDWLLVDVGGVNESASDRTGVVNRGLLVDSVCLGSSV